jgi:hypothetical protein
MSRDVYRMEKKGNKECLFYEPSGDKEIVSLFQIHRICPGYRGSDKREKVLIFGSNPYLGLTSRWYQRDYDMFDGGRRNEI